MKAPAFWNRLERRERAGLLLAGCVLVLFGLYQFGWVPYRAELTRLEGVVERKRADLRWMQAAATSLRDLGPAPAAADAPPLLTRLDASARRAGLADAIERMNPGRDGTLALSLRAADFDTLMHWLGSVSAASGVRVRSIDLRRSNPASADGRVSGQVTLSGLTANP